MKRVLGFVMLGIVPAAVSPAFADEPSYILNVAPVQRIRAVNTFELSYPMFTAEAWIIFACRAPDLPCQTDVSSELEPRGNAAVELGDRRRPILSARLKVAEERQKKTITYRVKYQATLQSRELVEACPDVRRPLVAELTSDERKASLASTATFYDFDKKPFRAWLDANALHWRKGEGEIDFARRVFLFIKQKFTYEARLDGDLHASTVCRTGRSDCHGLSVLFVAALRANGVPARCLGGKWARSMVQGVQIGDIPSSMQHVKAEFYVAGVGWIPVDPSAAVVHDKSKAGLDYFGKDRGDFLVFHVDFDLIIDTGPFGKHTFPSLWFAAWPTGTGDMDECKRREDWQVEVIPK